MTFHSIAIVLDLLALAVFGYLIFDVVHRYMASQPQSEDGNPLTKWEARWKRLFAAGQASATILWSKVVSIVAALAFNLDTIADLLGQPELKDFINQNVTSVKVASALALGIMVVNFIARKRTLGS